MCGTIGVIGRKRPAAPILPGTLERLGHRGHDSAGVAALVSGHVERQCAPGKLAEPVAFE